MDLYKRRVLKLREHVKNKSLKSNDKGDNQVKNSPGQDDGKNASEGEQVAKSIDDLTKDEIIKILKKLGIEHNKRSTKEELFALIP